MIVVVGSVTGRRRARSDTVAAGGQAIDVARAAAARGADVQIVGRVGDDAAGDAVLADVARAGVGHAAVARAAGTATPVVDEASDVATTGGASGLGLDAADLDLALRYLGDARVIIVTGRLVPAALAVIGESTAFGGGALVVIAPPGSDVDSLPADAIVLEEPATDREGSFAAFVGRLGAALDAGDAPGEAFERALGSPV